MTLLDNHLEQISLCATSIAEIPFPPPKIFTNALLQPHDITTLIRDTEAHERALFSVPATTPSASSRRSTIFPITNPTDRAPRRNTAAAAVLGTELVSRIQRGGGGGIGTGHHYQPYLGKDKQDVDVEALLEGAEKLCGVYPIPGAAEKIVALRQRHARLVGSIEHYEAKVAEQSVHLSRMNRARDFDNEAGEAAGVGQREQEQAIPLTMDDYRKEEEEIRTLEAKKRGLEERVSSMGKDIQGVMR